MNKSRRYLLTINNPIQTQEEIQEMVIKAVNPDYACGSYEVGESGTPHYHLFMYKESRMYFDRIKTIFPTAHIDYVLGTSQENRDYVFKIGKHEGTEKETTNDKNSHWEIGVIDESEQGKRNDITRALQMVVDGYSNYEIINAIPSMFTHPVYLDTYRQNHLIQTVGLKNRDDLKVRYLYGATGTGKTHWVYQKYGHANVYRVNSDSKNPFDNYQEQSVLLIDEFDSSFKIQDILQLLDKYPIQLEARYTNKWLCATTIIVVSNRPIGEMYPNIQKNSPEVYKAFLRRFTDGVWLKIDWHNMVEIDIDTNTPKI
jgi:hypothetical protein